MNFLTSFAIYVSLCSEGEEEQILFNVILVTPYRSTCLPHVTIIVVVIIVLVVIDKNITTKEIYAVYYFVNTNSF